MSILKRQVSSSTNFASFSIVMTQNSFVNFKLILFLLWIKGPHETPNFETFKYSGENLPYSSFHFPHYKSVFLQILHHEIKIIVMKASFSWKITPFLGQILNTLHNRNQWKCKFLRLLSACHFWNNRSVFFQILHQSSVFYTVLFCVPLRKCNLLLDSLILFFLDLNRKKTWQ